MNSSAELFKQNASTKTKEEYSCLNQFDVIKDNTIIKTTRGPLHELNKNM